MYIVIAIPISVRDVVNFVINPTPTRGVVLLDIVPVYYTRKAVQPV